MARAYIKIFCNRKHVRTFGGNKREVKDMKRIYEDMTINDFIIKHPTFKCKNKSDINIIYKVN